MQARVSTIPQDVVMARDIFASSAPSKFSEAIGTPVGFVEQILHLAKVCTSQVSCVVEKSSRGSHMKCWRYYTKRPYEDNTKMKVWRGDPHCHLRLSIDQNQKWSFERGHTRPFEDASKMKAWRGDGHGHLRFAEADLCSEWACSYMVLPIWYFCRRRIEVTSRSHQGHIEVTSRSHPGHVNNGRKGRPFNKVVQIN